MDTIGMTMQQVQVNTKFLNALPPEWSMFVTAVKLAKSLYTTNYDQLYAYLSQHERHANEALSCVKDIWILLHCTYSTLKSSHSSLAVPTFQQGDDPIECINKEIAFLSTIASRFLPSNNQLRTSSNPRNQETIQDGRVIIQQFKEKSMLVKAQEAGQILDEEQLAFIADPRIAEAQVAQQTIPQNSAFQLKTWMPMTRIDVQEMPYSEQTHIDDYPDDEINSDSNIIPYFQYLQESQNAGIQDTNSFVPNDLLVLSLVEQMTDHVASLDKEN
ncbi:hypothetical protein Tco_0475211 [Tanacetum coccineum]